MRIFLVTNNYTPYSGGLVSAIDAISNALRMEQHEVFIITLDFKPSADPSYVIRVPCPIKFMYKQNYMAIPWRPTHAIKQLVEQYKPDIIHAQHPFLLGKSALHAARTYNIPCVFTYHTMYEDYAHYVPLLKNYARPFIRAIVKRFCNAVDAIIAPSSAIKNYLVAEHVQTPITIIPSPLRSFFFDASPPKAVTAIKKPFELLLVSRFVPEKNVPFVFDVFKQLPEGYNLTLVGYGTDYDAMQDLAFKTLQLSPERIRFIHKPEQNELLNLYANADLFIFPSQTDTQGLVVTESMSQGVPAIALDGPGQRDIVVNGYNGFIINNAQQAAETIINIANNPELYNKLRSGAYQTAQKYKASAIIKRLLEVYHALLDQKE